MSNLVITGIILCIWFKCVYLRNQQFRNVFFKKGWASHPNYLRYHWLQKMRLLKCLKSLFWEQPLVNNVLNGFQTLLKPAWKHFYRFYWSVRWNIFPLLRSKILELFVNTLTANDKNSCHYKNILHNQFKCNYLRNQNIFL